MPESDTPILSADIADKWAKIRLAHEATMLQDSKEVLATQRRQATQYQATMLGDGNRPAEGDDMAGDIFIGDVTYQCAAPAVAPAPGIAPSTVAPSPQAAPLPPAATQSTPAAQAESTTGKLSPWISSAAVIAASAIGGGAAVPIAGAVLDWWNSPPAVTQPVEHEHVEPQPTPANPQPGINPGGVRIEPFTVGE